LAVIGLYLVTKALQHNGDRSTFYDETAFNLIRFAFDSSPLDCLVVVATPDHDFFAAK
jgi:hypothetical protein